MTSLLMKHLAKTVSMSAHAEQATITLDGVVHSVGATWYRRETDIDLMGEEHIGLEDAIRVPVTALPKQPGYGDPVSIDGKALFVSVCHLKGPVYLIKLTNRGPR